MKKGNRNLVIGVVALGAVALIWYLLKRKKKPIVSEQKALKDAYDNLQFELGKATIKPVSFTALDVLAQTLKDAPNWKLSIVGHTDNTGSEPFNKKLSKARAEAVKGYLTSKGIDASRITTSGAGSSKPIATNATNEGRNANRRVEFIIIKGETITT